jgi:hypothetical protein
MRHIITVTPGIAEALVSTFPHITAIGTPDPDLFIIGITAGIVVSKVARSLPVQQENKSVLVINLRTAKSLSLTVPPALLATAGRMSLRRRYPITLLGATAAALPIAGRSSSRRCR